MPEWPLLRALRGGHATRSLSLTGRRLCRLPWGLAKMRALECLDLRNNRLCRLPPDMEALGRLKVLNLGNNIFEEIPEQLMCLKSLQKLHLFGNKITRMSPLICGGLQNLVLLNLNNNLLSHLPPEIHRLENLECLSLNNNQLRSIPRELCSLQKLCELHLSHNSLTALPEEIGHLTELKILSLSRNQIEELPEGICKMVSLRVLDLAGNNIQIFPIAMQDLELVELYCEGNPLLQRHPVSAIQEEEVLTLKVTYFCLRFSNDFVFKCRSNLKYDQSNYSKKLTKMITTLVDGVNFVFKNYFGKKCTCDSYNAGFQRPWWGAGGKFFFFPNYTHHANYFPNSETYFQIHSGLYLLRLKTDIVKLFVEGFHSQIQLVFVGFPGCVVVVWWILFLMFHLHLWLASSEVYRIEKSVTHCAQSVKMPATDATARIC